MSFLENSGDIILDTVLTDEGRRRLAMGDGSFSITQFALGDDEINYALFETGSTTALQDLSILQTPILEAFTNNTSLMKTKLLSLPNPDLLFLPVLRLNTSKNNNVLTTEQGNFVVCVNHATWDDGDSGNTKAIAKDSNGQVKNGMIYGDGSDDAGFYIKVDSGIDSDALNEIDLSLMETQFIIEIDNRLGSIIDKSGTQSAPVAKVDDDNIAMYSLTRDLDPQFVKQAVQQSYRDADSPINGPIGATLDFKIRSKPELKQSNFLFDKLGSTTNTLYTNSAGAAQNVRFIDTIVRVSGVTTGYSMDIPVRFAKVI